jgi:hypothetical protein
LGVALRIASGDRWPLRPLLSGNLHLGPRGITCSPFRWLTRWWVVSLLIALIAALKFRSPRLGSRSSTAGSACSGH